MRIIINTFKYGNARTKFALLLMATGLLAGIGILVYSLVFAKYIATFAAIIILIADIGFIFSTDFRNLIIPNRKKKDKPASEKKQKESDDEEEDDDDGFALEWISPKKKDKAAKKEEAAKEEVSEKTGQERLEEALENLRKEKEKKKEIPPDVNPLTLYDPKRYKKLLIEYKVKQDHVLILIDSCEKERIFECPAILWKDKTMAYILLLEAEPRMIKFNMYDYNEMHIRAAVEADPKHEYKDFKTPTYIGKLFSPLLPNYTTTEEHAGRKATCRKALYGIGPDIFCTSNSVKNIIKVLSLNMVLTESRIQRNSYSDWFKRIYISRLMFRDNIFSAQDYQAQVTGILDEMAEKATNDDFTTSLNQMLLGGLIPQEYADYANFKRK